MASNTETDAAASVNQTEENVETTETFPELDSSADGAQLGSEDLTAEERYQQRLERFGKVAPEAKKISRAQRFGTPHEAIDDAAKKRRLDRFGVVPHSAEDEQAKKKTRADRFQLNTSTTSPAVDEEAKQKRVGRFGVVTPAKPAANGKSAPSTPVMTEEIKKRTERFGDVSQVAKAQAATEQKAKRAERFKPITSA